MAEGMKRHQRRSFTEEFKAEVVKKVLTSGKTAGQVARGLTETAVRAWVDSSIPLSRGARIWPRRAKTGQRGALHG
jgi:transposase-like protein